MFRLQTSKKRSPSISELHTSFNIPLTVIRSNRSSMGLEIKEGTVIARVPFLCADKKVIEFAESHRNWIEQHLEKSIRNIQKAESEGSITTDELKQLTKQAEAYIPGRVKYFAELAGVKYGKVTIRHQKTRWGSCSSRGNLNFNCLLMLTPPEVIDSVVVHEICHLKEMNHSSRFYSEVLKIFPEYYKWHGWLKKNGGPLLIRSNSNK